jgi:hypothetical protein
VTRVALAAFACALPVAAAAVDAKDPFELIEIASPERVVQGDLADLDGDGRGDLVWIASRGLPPEEQRELRVHLAGEDGTPSPTFSWRAALPSGTAAYDLAELDGAPGTELLLLRRDRITVFSLGAEGPKLRDLPLAGPTIAAVEDERGVDRLRLAREGLGPGPRLVVPGFGTAYVVAGDGTAVASLAVGGRANFLVPPRPGPVFSESEMEIYFDHPRLAVGDVDGDGRADVVTSNRHELRVFRQRDGGRFEAEPDLRQPLRRIALADHIRTSGSVRSEPHDFDGDGRLDLLIAHASGSLLGGDTHVSIHRNRDGKWDLGTDDQSFDVVDAFGTHEVIDLDGDGRKELVMARVPTGVLQIVELLLTRSLDAEVAVYRPGSGDGALFEPKPWQRWKTSVAFDFETLRSKGFVPTLQADVNGDGVRDLLTPGEGVRLEVRLGDRTKGFQDVHIEQACDTGGRIRFGDLDGDRRDDFVIYDPRRPGSPIRVGRNRGPWPGSPNISAGSEAR